MSSTSNQPPGGLSDDDRRAVETMYQAFGEGNPQLLDGILAPDWEDIPLPPGQQPGPEGIKAVVQGFGDTFPDAKFTVHDIIGSSGRAAVRAEITGTHTREFFGVAPSQRRFVVPVHDFHRIENGQLTHTWHLEDWFGWLNQVGGWPPADKENGQ